MSHRLKPAAILAVALGLLVGCGGGAREGATIQQAGTITLLEGLPHQNYEPSALAEEKRTKPTVDLHGFSFYRQPLAMSPPDQSGLKAWLADSGSYSTYAGEKKCGGFHSDYAIEWTESGQAHSALICFGCGEIKLFGPKGESIHDIPNDARKRIKALLTPYRMNRPEPKQAPG